MIRLIAGGVIALCVAYAGLGVKRYYNARKQFFEGLISFIDMMRGNINFQKKPLPDLIGERISETKGELNKMLTEYRKALLNADMQSIDNMKLSILKKEERVVLSDMLKIIGKSDSKTESDNLNGYRERFDAMLQTAIKQNTTAGGLAFKLSVLIGIVVMIVLA